MVIKVVCDYIVSDGHKDGTALVGNISDICWLSCFGRFSVYALLGSNKQLNTPQEIMKGYL